MGFKARVRVREFEALKDGRCRLSFEWETKEKLPPSTRCFLHCIHPQWASRDADNKDNGDNKG